MQKSIMRGENGEGEKERRKFCILVTLMIQFSCSLDRTFLFNFKRPHR